MKRVMWQTSALIAAVILAILVFPAFTAETAQGPGA